MQYEDLLAAGDKCSALNANKMVLMNIYPDDEAPYSETRKNEHIDVCSRARSMDGRMITSIMKTGALNKLLIELQRKCCEIYGEDWKDLHQIAEELK